MSGEDRELRALCELFGELANPVRMLLLHALSLEPATVTALSERVELSPQEVSRHLARLGGLGLVARAPSRAFHATAYGRVVVEELPNLAALQAERGFFDEHDLSGLPPLLPMRPLALARHSEAGEAAHQAEARAVLGRATRRITYAGAQVAWVAQDLAAAAARDVGVELVVPWTLAASEALLGLEAASPAAGQPRVAVRLVDHVGLLLAATEQEAFAFFPRPKGSVDFGHLVYGDGGFHAWAEVALARLREGSVLAFDPQRQPRSEWRLAVTLAAGTFIGRSRRS